MGYGHDVCSRLVRGKRWHFNDERVQEMILDEEMKDRGQAYVILLERQQATEDGS